MDIEQDLQNKIKEFELNEKVNLARGESVKWPLFFFYPFRLFRSNKVMKENTRPKVIVNIKTQDITFTRVKKTNKNRGSQ